MTKSKLLNRARIILMKKSPELYVLLAEFAAKNFMFKAEKEALKGNFSSQGEGVPIIHFVYNRCGSRYVSQVMKDLLSEKCYSHLDYERFAGHCQRGDKDFLLDENFLGEGFSKRGFIYGPLYHFHGCFSKAEELSEYKIVLNLRDPRDVLTSRFFSQAFAHTLFHSKHIQRRKEVQEMGIDAFVREQTAEIKERYQTYFEHLVGRSNVLFLPYEKMVGNFEQWLKELCVFLEVDPNGPAAMKVLAEANFTVSKEDKFAHRRSVQPGNHLKKLKPETVDYINKELGGLLAPFKVVKSSR